MLTMWNGPRVVARLGLTDEEITRPLRGLNITVPGTVEERLARLAGYPTGLDLDALARIYTPQNNGVRPVARVLDNNDRRLSTGRRRSDAMNDIDPLVCIGYVA